MAMLLISSCSGFMISPSPVISPAPLSSHKALLRSAEPPLMRWRGAKGIPKGKVPDTKGKKDDKSWGPLEWFAELAGADGDDPDTGPKLGGRSSKRGMDESGNFKGDRRIINSKTKKTANEGAKFNPLDASTW